MIAEKLRQAVLQAAISGQLTEQRPEDGTAAELLEEITEQRDRLVKVGKLKKQKPLQPITDDEKAFVVPETWKWIRLGSVIDLLSGRDLSASEYSSMEFGIPYVTGASNFQSGQLYVNRWTNSPITIAKQGDLLITCKGTIGDLAVLQEPEAHIARQVMAISPMRVDTSYVKSFLTYSVSALKAQAKSMIPGISREMVLQMPLSLPPLAEQERIVAKLDQIMPMIDQLEKLERERERRSRPHLC